MLKTKRFEFFTWTIFWTLFDEFFRLFLNELNPAIRTEVKYILNLYQYIIKFNIFKDRLFLLNDYLSKDLIYKLLNEFNKTRE